MSHVPIAGSPDLKPGQNVVDNADRSRAGVFQGYSYGGRQATVLTHTRPRRRFFIPRYRVVRQWKMRTFSSEGGE